MSALNTEFRIRLNRSQAVVKLAELADLDHRRSAHSDKEGFSLLFKGSGASALAQNTYTLEHEKLGTFSLLLVPTPNKKKNQVAYEAVINRLYP